MCQHRRSKGRRPESPFGPRRLARMENHVHGAKDTLGPSSVSTRRHVGSKFLKERISTVLRLRRSGIGLCRRSGIGLCRSSGIGLCRSSAIKGVLRTGLRCNGISHFDKAILTVTLFKGQRCFPFLAPQTTARIRLRRLRFDRPPLAHYHGQPGQPPVRTVRPPGGETCKFEHATVLQAA